LTCCCGIQFAASALSRGQKAIPQMIAKRIGISI
jgi:hypothetical protein